MSFFKTGFESYESELKEEDRKAKESSNKVFPFSLKPNETKEVIILDDTGFRFHEFSFYNQATRKSVSFTCRGDGDFLNIHKNPALITVMTVKDMAGYVDQNGNRKGVGDLKPFKLKKNAAKRINNLRQSVAAQKASEMWNGQRNICDERGLKSEKDVLEAILKKGNVLKNCRIRCSRIADKAESSGDDFSFVTWVKQEAFKPDEKPFDYEKLFAPKSDEEIKQELMQFYNGQPPFDLGMEYTGQTSGGGDHKESYSGGQDSTYDEAPSYTADDIPF